MQLFYVYKFVCGYMDVFGCRAGEAWLFVSFLYTKYISYYMYVLVV